MFVGAISLTDPAFVHIAAASGQVVSVMAQNTEMGSGHTCKMLFKVFVLLTMPLCGAHTVPLTQ